MDKKNDEIVFVIKESDEGGYETRALNHKIYTEAENLKELKKNIREAVNLHFDKEKLKSLIL